ncbi:MAG: hypothetical protein IPL95_07680 [Saprospiraceae bacterium]|nr:hypothetical protein [Saprospiraceae bacterium]
MDLKSWKTGSYVIEITANDDKGKQIEKKQFFKLYDLAAKEIPTNQPYQLTLDKASYEPGENCNLFLTTKKATNLYYEVEKQGEIISNKWMKLDGTEKLNFSIQESDRGNFHFNITFVQNNRFYQESQTIVVPWTNKDLTIEYETFRDKLLPGEDEVWKLKIKGYKKDKLFAELLATMYDASLDQFVSHNFNKPILFPTSFPNHTFQNYGFDLSSLLYNSKQKENIAYLRNTAISYPNFCVEIFSHYYLYNSRFSRSAVMDEVILSGDMKPKMKMEDPKQKLMIQIHLMILKTKIHPKKTNQSHHYNRGLI